MDAYRVYATQMASVNIKYNGGIVLKRFFFFFLGERAALTTQIVVDYIDNIIKCISIQTL